MELVAKNVSAFCTAVDNSVDSIHSRNAWKLFCEQYLSQEIEFICMKRKILMGLKFSFECPISCRVLRLLVRAKHPRT
jgi:hypothetical protein